MRGTISRAIAAALLLAASGGTARAEKATDCTANGFCYCVEQQMKSEIDGKVASLRAHLAAERAKGKAVGYLSVPLSPAGGGFMKVNFEVAASIKQAVEARLGPKASFVLDPGAPEWSLPKSASGADYMLMWTQLLEGKEGLGEEFDFVYFAGPRDFGRYFGLDGTDDLVKLEFWFEWRLGADGDFKAAVEKGSVTKTGFRNYYGLKAQVAFSRGAHDEWNIIRAINEKRRTDRRFGTAGQIPVLFDGLGASPADSEAGVSPGYVGACPK